MFPNSANYSFNFHVLPPVGTIGANEYELKIHISIFNFRSTKKKKV